MDKIMNLNKEEIKEYLLKNKQIVPGNCWFLINRNNNGYEYFRGIGIHRLSVWIFKDFDLDSNLNILHKCDCNCCWNPDHLFEGTQSDNRKDSINKQRSDKLFGNALNLKNRTHCNNGHEFTILNTHYNKKGHRTCIICRREYENERYHRLKKNG